MSFVKKRRKQTKASKIQYTEHKEKTRELVHGLLNRFIEEYKNLGYDIPQYKQVFIKNTTSRWGSCSSKSNLNFSYKLSLIPLHLAEYIVVHELCHLKEFNHGAGFWDLVAKVVPDYEVRVAELKRVSLS